MKRLASVASVLAICLGLLLVVSARPAGPAPTLPTAVAGATTTPAPTPTVSPSQSPTATPTPPIPPGYRIKLARLAIDLPIAEGDVARDTVRQETPNDFAFHLPGTALPGDRGNAYLYAHARRGMFLSLWSVRDGDVVVIVTPDARELRYVVSEVHARVDPGDLSWARQDTGERLTLQTSTGPDPGDPRFVVIALPA